MSTLIKIIDWYFLGFFPRFEWHIDQHCAQEALTRYEFTFIDKFNCVIIIETTWGNTLIQKKDITK